MQNSKVLELKNGLDKSLYQAEGILNLLLVDEHFSLVSQDNLASVLLIIDDKIEEIKTRVEELYLTIS